MAWHDLGIINEWMVRRTSSPTAIPPPPWCRPPRWRQRWWRGEISGVRASLLTTLRLPLLATPPPLFKPGGRGQGAGCMVEGVWLRV